MLSNQHIIYPPRPEARNRLNTIFMVGMFVGGALGSAAASLAWMLDGWIAVCALGFVFVFIAMVLRSSRRWPAASTASTSADQEG